MSYQRIISVEDNNKDQSFKLYKSYLRSSRFNDEYYRLDILRNAYKKIEELCMLHMVQYIFDLAVGMSTTKKSLRNMLVFHINDVIDRDITYYPIDKHGFMQIPYDLVLIEKRMEYLKLNGRDKLSIKKRRKSTEYNEKYRDIMEINSEEYKLKYSDIYQHLINLSILTRQIDKAIHNDDTKFLFNNISDKKDRSFMEVFLNSEEYDVEKYFKFMVHFLEKVDESELKKHLSEVDRVYTIFEKHGTF